MKKTILITILAISTVLPLGAVNFVFSAAGASAIAAADDTPLPTGSLLRLGVFDISNAEITANANDLAYLNTHFIEITDGYIGQGDPWGVGEMDPQNNGLFLIGLQSVDTTLGGLNIAGMQVVYWVFNAADFASATEHGIFTSSLSSWTIPSGDGSGADYFSVSTDISALTENYEGLTLATTAQILVGGGLGTTINPDLGGKNFTLATLQIPEPSTYAALLGLAAAAFLIIRRRK